jgi:hypothetical protein
LEIEAHQWKPIVEGVAALAVTFAEMGDTEDEARGKLAGYMQSQLDISQVDAIRVLKAAAESVASFPQPPDESAERLARGESVRKMLGVPEPSESLAKTLMAREWLQTLAADLEAGLEGTS